ncbi:MAG TPA: hypothetical protein VGO58_09370 [Chitinophagaceae bacterium]|jgi:hypothetical protein|nr:hypothetical protein [Chitinophagaceae bacterium]
MKNFLLYLGTAVVFFSCNQKEKDKKQPDKKTEKGEYTITKDGIGELKIGMSDAELERLVNDRFKFRMVVDSPGYWQDTIRTKYKDLDVSLYFERQYGNSDSTYMQLSGLETNSALCKTEYGVGIGDDRSAILEPYDDRAIYMGPEYEQTNDTTWAPSKTKYSVNVKDDKWDREIIFHLVNKKVASLGAGIIMGE